LKEGESLSIVDGSRENIKLTQPIDFIIAEKLIDGKSN
jgi:2-C-methyl-D-erythritol 4-phosphate cytidylyltransferase